MRKLPALTATVGACLLVAVPASGAPRVGASWVAADPPRVPRAPMLLPGSRAAATAAAAADADPGTWLVGARSSAAARRLASRARAKRVIAGVWSVDRTGARRFAALLRERGLLTFAEPDRASVMRQAPPRAVADDPHSAAVPWRDAAVDPSLPPPPITADTPLLALVDAKADVSHPEFGSGHLTSLSGEAVTLDHGTATAAVAIAPVNGFGMVGVWPGLPAVNVPLPESIFCRHSARGIKRAVAAGADVVNMSYGSPRPCYAEFLALQRATRRGVTLVAAAGNEFDQGNPLEYPASLPHVLTVGASTPDDQAAFFSNENAAMDLVAPGIGIVTAVPVALDTADGEQDGYTLASGTSFSAPMVAAAAAWVRQARPELTVDQVAQVLRLGSRDIHEPGYDVATGFGALNLGGEAGSLARRPPIADSQEPNEDVEFVDGRRFKRANPAIFSGAPARREALLDLFEDPGDVYRIRVPGRRGVRIAVRPRFGNPDLAVLDGAADHVGQKRFLIALSRRSGTATDAVRIRNRGRRTRTAYVRVWIRPNRQVLDAGYTLTVR